MRVNALAAPKPATSPKLAFAVPVRWVVAFALWTAVGLVSSTQLYWMYKLKEPGFTFGLAAIWQMPPWYYWGLASPAIFWLQRRFPLEHARWPASLAVLLAANVVFATGYVTVVILSGRAAQQQWFFEEPFLKLHQLLLLKYLHLELTTYWGIVAAGHALDYRKRYRERELAAAQLETQLAHAQLDALKAQLHPHFLFNTLHAIAVLVRKQDTQGSIRMLTGVSELLRLALENVGRQLVPLKQELDFVDRYLEIEKTRFQDRLVVEQRIAPDTLDAEVPNLLLQPLVENAIKHGIAPRASSGRIELEAQRMGELLRITVSDDGCGLPESASKPWGVGCTNVSARLRQLYGDKARFALEPRTGGGVVARVELPFRRGEHA